ncbi:MAG TPA: DUF3788 family protein [Nocardioides sp.]|nr:DUF3788 family protein [Nocardioides sp.]
MPERRVPVLTDPAVTPDDEQIRDLLGDSFAGWRQLTERLADVGLDLTWRHYRDGGWLCRAVRGGKNVAWLAVWDGYATATCYFAARHRADLTRLPVPEALRAEVAAAEMSGSLLPVVVEIRTSADAGTAAEVVRFKLTSR